MGKIIQMISNLTKAWVKLKKLSNLEAKDTVTKIKLYDGIKIACQTPECVILKGLKDKI